MGGFDKFSVHAARWALLLGVLWTLWEHGLTLSVDALKTFLVVALAPAGAALVFARWMPRVWWKALFQMFCGLVLVFVTVVLLMTFGIGYVLLIEIGAIVVVVYVISAFGGFLATFTAREQGPMVGNVVGGG
ncbi:MAG: hypothetical protein EKK59_02670 [Neisseriaceae bacterium]|nr:MAG: hypothetical protein EKK59_02670 [Neisseriaceae bacterium]